MKKTVFTILCMTTLMLASCNTKNNPVATNEPAEAEVSQAANVEYVEAQNYFHRNDAPVPDSLKITTAEEFERHFGMAANMSENGKPTEIDFSKSFVIAKVLPETNLQTELRPVSLTEVDGHLLLTYSLKQGEEQSYSTQPMFILIVPKEYQEMVIKEQAE